MRPLPVLVPSSHSQAKLKEAKLSTALLACGYAGVFRWEAGMNQGDSAAV